MANRPDDSDDGWEQICLRCGNCCFEKWIDEGGTVYPTAVPCRYLDIHSRSCRIYHQRLQAEEDCIKLTPALVPQLNWLPATCAYRNLGLQIPEK